ncbi:MAG: ISNCY family transposase [Candidatus Omnitrophica bacterium]|nr:ISNCY family transposase [Candidatus Omnitrophota bacterium]
MAGKDIITMTQGELRRLHVIRKAIDKHITQTEAADIIGVCLRQAQRIVRAVRVEGDKGIIHRSRGKLSNRAIPDKTRNKALMLFKTKYPDFGPTLASEKLFERDRMEVNNETLRLWLIDADIPYRKRKKRPHRQWRERKERYGQMVQMDGSEHDWLEGRDPKCVLMGYIDDATGTPFGRFHAYEGTIPAMDSFKRYIKKRGIPLSIYLDKHATYKSTKKQTIEEELANQKALSQFERALKELGVKVIHANSPQAKGRIERIFNTFQDRLIKEMRLADICTIDQANAFLEKYLPVYAKRFAIKPAKKDNLHRPVPKSMDLNRILCIKTKRALRNDFTVAHNKRLYQILDNIRAKRVVVEDKINGSMVIRHKDTALKFKQITVRSKKEEPKRAYEFKPKEIYIPPKDHPWRKFKMKSYPQNYTYSQKEKSSKKEKELLLIH